MVAEVNLYDVMNDQSKLKIFLEEQNIKARLLEVEIEERTQKCLDLRIEIGLTMSEQKQAELDHVLQQIDLLNDQKDAIDKLMIGIKQNLLFQRKNSQMSILVNEQQHQKPLQ